MVGKIIYHTFVGFWDVRNLQTNMIYISINNFIYIVFYQIYGLWGTIDLPNQSVLYIVSKVSHFVQLGDFTLWDK